MQCKEMLQLWVDPLTFLVGTIVEETASLYNMVNNPLRTESTLVSVCAAITPLPSRVYVAFPTLAVLFEQGVCQSVS